MNNTYLADELDKVFKERIKDLKESRTMIDEKIKLTEARREGVMKKLKEDKDYCQCSPETREIEGNRQDGYFCINIDCQKEVDPDFEQDYDPEETSIIH